MNLSEFRKKSHEYTSKASEISRQLSLGGIAIIWLFKKDGQHLIETYLIWPLFFLSISLLLDLLHYFLGGIIWIDFFKKNERTAVGDPDIKAPKIKSNVLYAFYYAKIISMMFAYFFIIGYITSKL